MKMTDTDRCILLLALRNCPDHLDALSTQAYVSLCSEMPWLPYSSLAEWAKQTNSLL